MSQRVPCPYCGSKSFDEEDGIIICGSCGRTQEGGLQIEDDEPEFGTQGKIVRKKVEKKKIKVTRIYRGPQAYRLYLQAWQYILWRQAYALIHGPVKAPSGLWMVVRDLWTLKLAKLGHKLSSDDIEDPNTQNETIADSEEIDTEDTKVEVGLAPRLPDTIALFYASALLIHWPVTLHELYEMIRSEDLPYVRAIRHVPFEMSSRLPPEYQLALDTITLPRLDDIQQATYRIMHFYSINHGIAFPAFNWRPLLFRWIKDLGMPIEIYPHIEPLAALVKYDFTFQILPSLIKSGYKDSQKKLRRSPVTAAEHQLLALTIIATKLLFPFPDNEGQISASGHQNLCLDWSKWQRIHCDETRIHIESMAKFQPGKQTDVRDRDILDMTPGQLDSYMDWYQKTFALPEVALLTKKTDLEKKILDMFPVPDLPQALIGGNNTSLTGDIHSDDVVAAIQAGAMSSNLPPHPRNHEGHPEQQYLHPEEELPRPGSKYPIFSTIASLSPTPQEAQNLSSDKEHNSPILYFHEQAAGLVGLDLSRLLKAVRHTERKLEIWIDQRRREEIFGLDAQATYMDGS